MLATTLYRVLGRPLFRALSGDAVITKVLIDLERTAGAYYSLNTPIVMTGDFEIEIDVLINSNARFMVFSGGTSSGDFELFLDGEVDGALSYRVGGSNPSGTTSVQNYFTINELRPVKVKRVGTTVTLSSPNRTDFVVTISGSLSINNFAARPSVSSLFLDGIESNLKVTDVSTPANNVEFGLDKLTGTTEVSNGFTLTYNNIATTDDVRNTYVLSNGGTQWISDLRTINIAAQA